MREKIRATWELVDAILMVGLYIGSLIYSPVALMQGDITKAVAFFALALALSAHFRIDNSGIDKK